MYTNVIMILLNRAVQIRYMYDDFESYESGMQKHCFLNTGVSLSQNGIISYALTTGCVNVFKNIFYDTMESYAPGTKE